MAFKFSLGTAKASKAQLNAKAKEEEEAKAREEKNALDKVMADFEAEHGAEKSILGEAEHQEEEDVFVPTGSKRHFTGRQRTMKSGPGTLETEPLDGYNRPGVPPGRLAPQMQSRLGGTVPTGPAALDGPKQTENYYTTVVAKASNLPPDIDSRRVEELFADYPTLKITRVDRVPPKDPSATAKGRPSATMKITFDKDANARDLDAAMNKLNDKKYLGKGYYLHLDRYLGGRSVDTAQQSEAFGARWEAPELPKGFAPPPNLGGAGGASRDRPREDTEHLIITANRPPDAATLRLVHQTIEGVILGGIEFEAALMNEPQVQEEERFAWLYDQKHPVNRYYRWRLHQIVTNSTDSEIFERYGAWRGPVDPLPHEFADHLGAFESDDDSLDSEDEDEKEKPQYKLLPVGDNYPGRVDNGHGIMNPKSRAMLLWLLSTIPPGSIVLDDIAAISNFAVEHAAEGMDEVTSILVSNIIQPFQLTDANTRNRANDAEGKDDLRRPNIQQVTLNALRIVSDVLLVTSKESGVSYKYRLAIGTELVDRKVFEHLERLPAKLEMGRMTEKTYREDVNTILAVWKEDHLFEDATLKHLDDAFNARERQKEEEEQARRVAERRRRKGNVTRKVPTSESKTEDAENEEADQGVDGEETMEDWQAENDACSQTASQMRSPTPEAPEVQTEVTVPAEVPKDVEIPGETAVARARRLRPKAEDMFALDEED
jgi:U2-associated protein SR140